ncbi:MAG: prephenate dehydrogenase/arogenate dehydrogenase family protein [Gemmatimonadetes bacterium]|nr:prephenate dehydrogenase/arogenate dehydrogenase family protein [Gemmatimonadota bacterium]
MTEPGPVAFPTRGGGAVTIVGLGVMGGSIAKALMRRAPRMRIFGIEPDGETAARAAGDGVRLRGALEECEIDGGVVVFAAPLDAVATLVRTTRATWARAALATDVTSLKVPVLEAVGRGAAGRHVFVGAHPMCGSERSGYGAAEADLFDGADVWLCPPGEEPGTPAAHAEEGAGAPRGTGPIERARTFWRFLGGRPRVVAAARHDRVMAWASHLPQLLASALASSLEEAAIGHDELGPGGRDMTRLAGSNPDMWAPLLEAAAKEDAGALRAVEVRLAAARRMLERGDLAGVRDMLERGRRWTAATR